MKTIFSIPSSEKGVDLRVIEWCPDTVEKPRAVLQIVHGMAEHIDRYDEFARFLNQNEIAVIGHDHLGHGGSVSKEKAKYGYFAPKEAKERLLEDVEKISLTALETYADVPLFLMGHSMGSFIVRNYLQRTKIPFAGTIIMGTGGKRPEIKSVLPILKLLDKQNGEKVNHLMNQMAFGHYRHFYPDAQTEFDWLSRNRENVTAFMEDPLCGFVFTNNGFYTLFQLIEGAAAAGWAERIPKNQAYLVISGEEDPVGQMGKGPYQTAKELSAAGISDVTLQRYPHLRHEILNEAEKEMVFQDIFRWFEHLLETEQIFF